MAQDNDFVMNLSHGYYLAIGEFMFRCSQLEIQMHEIVWLAIDIDYKKGRTLTIGAGTKAVRGILGTITAFDRWIPDTKKSLKQEINYLKEHSKSYITLRNRIAHGAWQTKVQSHGAPRLLFMKERDEKLLALFDSKLDDAYISEQCKGLKKLNHRAKQLIYDLHIFRGLPTSRLHSLKDLR